MQLTTLDADTLLQIAVLMARIKGGTYTVAEYLRYITTYQQQLGLFALYGSGVMQGYIHVEPPHPLDKEMGYVSAACGVAGLPRKQSLPLLEEAEAWLKERGATKWKCETLRTASALERRWGLRPIAEEQILGRDIQ